MIKFLKNIGPGAMITAAFIGPGTVTVCILAGNTYQMALLWALVFACYATITLQEMSARLGLASGSGLGEVIRNNLPKGWISNLSFMLIAVGILFGNAAYEAGNISGGIIGLKMMIPFSEIHNFVYTSAIYIIVFCLLFFGTYKMIEKFFIGIVIIMSLAFIVAAIISKPDIVAVWKGLLIPSIPDGSLMTIVALVGTTVVPYNLFLHASMINKKWSDMSELKAVRRDTFFSILIGGLISICIIITGAASYGMEIKTITDLGQSFETMYGTIGKFIFGFGIFAAGLTSTLTAPLAAGLVAKGLFGWDDNMKNPKFRMVWILILSIGYIFASSGYKPIEIIKLAQFANGLLLPMIACFLIWAVNQKNIMGEFNNSKSQNIMGFIVVLISVILGLKSIITLF